MKGSNALGRKWKYVLLVPPLSNLSFGAGPGGKHVLKMVHVLNMLGNYTPNTDSDLVLLAHERSELFKSITVFYRGCLTAAPGIE